MIFVYFIAKRRNYPAEAQASRSELLQATLHAIPPMGMPIIILGGIIGGVMTPTEAACAGAAYAFVLGFFVYGELQLRDFPKIITESVAGTAAVAIIIAAAQPMGWILTYQQAPMKVLALFQDAQFSKAMLLLIINVIMLILGCFLEGLAVMVMAVPVLMPLLRQAGIDPLHFGVLFVLNIMIGTVTPPVGTIMYVVCALGKISIGEFAREAWPFILALTICLFIVTYVPILSTWLPDLLMPVR
jgi:C4-dicarboxylate transporter DctM subunit